MHLSVYLFICETDARRMCGLSASAHYSSIPLLRSLAYNKERLSVLYRLAVLNQDLCHCACEITLDLIHQLHCLYNCKHLALFDTVPLFDKRLRILGRSRIKRTYER